MFKIMGAAFAATLALASQAMAADAPSEIKIGTLYASSGRFASISMPVHSALKLWAEQKLVPELPIRQLSRTLSGVAAREGVVPANAASAVTIANPVLAI